MACLRALPAACALLALAATAQALDVSLSAPHSRSGWAVLDARLSDLFEERTAQSIARGMPATLQVHSELWRRRNLWFDALDHTFDASVRVRYEVWSERYRVEQRGTAPLRFSTLDSVAIYLSRPVSLPIGRLSRLQPNARYYAVVTVTLKPLTVEDVEEVEGWISGEPSGDGITALPRSVFDAVRGVSGFGDRKTRTTSSDFVPAQLEERAP